MQSKKEELKRDIEMSALRIFCQKGYQNTKMLDIANDINISVGNIYTYFKNKEDLFYTVVPYSLVETLKKELIGYIHEYNQSFDEGSETIDDHLQERDYFNIFLEYRYQIIIIMDKSVGTDYENTKDEVIDSMLETKRTYLRNMHKRYHLDIEDSLRLMRIIVTSFASIISDLLQQDMSDESKEYVKGD